MSFPVQPTSDQEFTAFVQLQPTPCPLCRAPLQNATSAICPTCHDPLILTIGLVKPKFKLWLLMTASLLLPAGVGLLLLIVLAVQYRLPPQREILLHSLFVLAIPLALTAVIVRRRFNLLPLVVRLFFAVSSLLYVLTSFAYFASFLH